MGHDYIAKVEKHVSQTDYSQGFGGKYGVQSDRVDKVVFILIGTRNKVIVYVTWTFFDIECRRLGAQRTGR